MATPPPTRPPDARADPPGEPAPTGFDAGLAAAYAALLVYGTLFPLTGWRVPPEGIRALLAEPMLVPFSRTDILFNVLIYLPLGLLAVRLTPARWGPWRRVASALAAGLALSLVLECVQAFLPGRTSSARDLALNGLGGLAGAWAGVWAGWGRWAPHRLAERLRTWRARRVPEGAAASLGLWAVACWALAELAPLVPWPSRNHLWYGVKPLRLFAGGEWPFDPVRALAFGLGTAAVVTLLSTLLKPGARPWTWGAGLVGAVLALQVPVVARQLTPEALAGAALGLAGARGLMAVGPEPRLRLTAWLALFAAAAARLHPAAEAGAARIRWVPFAGQMAGLHGPADILGAVWPYLAVAYVGVRLRLAAPWAVAAGGAVAVAAWAFGLELLQAHVPGRYPDATDPLLAVLAWLLPWCHPAVRRAADPGFGRPD